MAKMNINIKDKRLWIAAAVIIAIVVVFFQINKKDQVYIYEFAKTEKGEVAKTVSVSGDLDLFERVFVRSEIGGEITEVHTDYNEEVNEDDLLVEIYSEDIIESFESYVDTYRFKQVDLQNSRDLYQTKQDLFSQELISERELSDAKVAYQRMLSSFKDVEKEYLRKKELLDSRMVYSPVSGTVINKNVEPNQVIGGGHVLFEIATTLEKLKLTINIDESDIGLIKKDQKVSFRVSAYPDEEFFGTIREIRMNPHKIDGVTVYKSLVICENRDNMLKPGMSATATIHIGNRLNVLRVPNQSLVVIPPDVDLEELEKSEKTVVWKKKDLVVDGIPYEKVEIDTGLVGDSYTEITSTNIKESEEILISIIRESQ
jgi:HlyD family secretion protein